jgi:hypothetical protein
VKITGSPLGTPLFWAGMILGIGGIVLALFATPTATGSAAATTTAAGSGTGPAPGATPGQSPPAGSGATPGGEG